MIDEDIIPHWDLSNLYKNRNDPQIELDFKTLEQMVANFAKSYKNKVKQLTGKILGKALKEYETIQDLSGRLSSFAYLQYSENISDNQSTALYQNITERINQISSSLLFFTIELNKISENELKDKFSQSTSLRYYAPWIRDVRAFKPYQLDEKLEKLFHDKQLTSTQSWHRLFEETIADMRFEYGKRQMTSTEIFDLLSEPDEQTRKKAAKSISQSLQRHHKVFTLITNTLAKDKSIEDQWRGFEAPISSRNLANLIEDNVAEALIQTVKANYANLSHRYYAIKAKWLGKTHLNYWDRNAPLPQQEEKYISFQEAKQIVTSAYFSFSPSMARISKQFFTHQWIDAAVRPGKDSGAFSHPTVPSANPYILLNYQGKIRDVMTLAHELGHGVHQVLASKQGALMCDTPLTLAETASVFGEQLTFRALLKRQKNAQQRNIMIAHKIEDMLNTVVRQVAFCEFERQVHNERKHGELASQTICDIWMATQQEALGPSIKLNKDYQYYWTYIPHFIHTPFYVYAYAFGDCLVNSLYQVYLDNPEGFEAKYLAMLQAGGTLRHKELLAPFGLNASNPRFWQKGLDTISHFIDQLEE